MSNQTNLPYLPVGTRFHYRTFEGTISFGVVIDPEPGNKPSEISAKYWHPETMHVGFDDLEIETITVITQP